ncbi:MAG: hypothetical protein ACQEQV_04530 [Fibrobacterota bacterium]
MTVFRTEHRDDQRNAFLDQCGIIHAPLGTTPLEQLPRTQILILTPQTSRSIQEIRAFLNAGRTVLSLCPNMTADLLNTRVRRKFICSSMVETDTARTEQLDLFCRVHLLENQLCRVEEHGPGLLAFWGIPLHIIDDDHVLRKAFPAGVRKNPAEEVSRISKGTAVRLFQYFLRRLARRRGIGLVLRDRFRSEPLPLLFRIDTDYGSRRAVQEWQSRSAKKGIKTTWFIHTAAHQSWLDLFTANPEDEGALHCRNHHPRQSTQELRKAIRELTAAGIRPRGYAAPYGIHRRTINRALMNAGITYGSDFSCLYDAPPLMHKKNLLQIPIHPVCINSFTAFGIADEVIRRYFFRHIDLCTARRRPIILYDHLLHDRTGLRQEILNYALQQNAVPATFSEYAATVQKDYESSSRLYEDKDILRNPGGLPLALWYSEDRVAAVRTDVPLAAEKLPAQTYAPPPHHEEKCRRLNLRELKNMLLTRYYRRKP